jgi:alanine racemase
MRAKVLVDLKTLKRNAEVIKSKINSDTQIFWVVKANAYGHGSLEVVRALKDADGFCVATTDEGLEIRKETKSPILVLGQTEFKEKYQCVKNDLQLTVWNENDVEELKLITDNMSKCASVHLAVNTGMNRIGVRDEKIAYKLINDIKLHKNLQLAGVFSHFFDSKDEHACYLQNKRFLNFTKGLGENVKLHLSASGMLLDEKFRYDAMRVGIALYGYGMEGVTPCLSVLSKVVCVNYLTAGESVGYGGRFVASEDCAVATISIGYADGVSRKRVGGNVIIRGRKRKLVGSICMDFCFALVDSEVKVGDDVIVIGGQGGENITADDVAKMERTINYEVLTDLKRIKYIYFK